MYLRSLADQEINLREIDLTVNLSQGEKICTEISRKYDRQKVKAMLESAGLKLIEWMTDENSLYALSLSKLN